jgi:hypothetical protein
VVERQVKEAKVQTEIDTGKKLVKMLMIRTENIQLAGKDNPIEKVEIRKMENKVQIQDKSMTSLLQKRNLCLRLKNQKLLNFTVQRKSKMAC